MADSAPPLQLAAAVSAVVSAFHAAADLVSQLRRRHHAPSRWRSASISTSASTSASTAGTPTVACTKAEQTVKEKLLQDSLAASELHISQRYAAHYAELGTKFQVGDDIARNTLLRLAILLQSELVRSLQIALQHDAARLDWARLQEDALISRRDTISALDGLRGRLVAGACSSATTFSRHTSTSDRSTLSQSSASDYSDKIPVCSIDEETTSPLARLNLTLLPAHLSPVPSMHLTAPHSPVSSASVPSTLPSPTADSSYQRWSLTAAPPSPSQHPALAPHLHTTSQAAPPLVAAPHLLLGRPSKENNYWGFCRGAWDAREEFTKAVQLHTVPAGLYSSRQVWRCRQCAFEGVAVATAPKPGEKKGLFGRTKRESRVGFDQRVRVFEAASGNGVVRFRWAFLAKSHVKRKTGAATGTMSTGGGGMAGAGLGFGGPLSRSSTSSEGSQSLAGPGQRASMAGLARGPEDGAFGCTFCTGEGRGTGIFGGVAALMEHILDVHGSRGVSWEVAERNRCIMERVAGEDENWDINILPVAGQERKVFQGEWEMEA
ncbi:hypothetical protein EJ06DRAFT_550336 [Trichodelitschia bisporula]|uniref:Uncharacterized protein n=1 Tax=Trichodelitschia bisporula TaxID=703511 RepID=A0A6G1HRB1_9PEZI|nr:hypothetical protein EJ06DRAFT_550336 [Trichodelitschia bisporula]